jgi:general secretion pathway protein N
MSRAPKAILLAAVAGATAWAGPNVTRSGSAAPVETAYAPASHDGSVTVGAPVALALAPGGKRATERGNPLWKVPLSALTETRGRPLFSASRRPPALVKASPPPPPPPVAPATPDPPEAPPIALVGTIVNGTFGVALVKNPSTQAVSGVRVGEETAGWTIRSVGARSIVVEKGARSETLDLPADRNKSAVSITPDVQLSEDRRGQQRAR